MLYGTMYHKCNGCQEIFENLMILPLTRVVSVCFSYVYMSRTAAGQRRDTPGTTAGRQRTSGSTERHGQVAVRKVKQASRCRLYLATLEDLVPRAALRETTVIA